MKDRVRKLFPSPVFKSLIWIFFGILLILPLLAFYPWKYRVVFVFLFVCFTILDLLFPLVATFFWRLRECFLEIIQEEDF
ncbi:hypothetical protein LEP1GSC083_4919 [Leptospira interrogans serovar Pyrogenes str. L0374]|uniref:Uncharacterized protein n=2 Tax=Leptospira interrogans serovar Pyrogenes TaxID=280500 RepID=M6ZRV5_LEPIR|nr:hypothetical protein LEP1GSC083_4919 [Leptospira interrogans serovar Pyrogenes str. L0374]EMP08796.1 hypothetical protein LEP1GSC124_1723 [Leptospira interrogans serovar Pyrogenes str. 200701872]